MAFPLVLIPIGVLVTTALLAGVVALAEHLKSRRLTVALVGAA